MSPPHTQAATSGSEPPLPSARRPPVISRWGGSGAPPRPRQKEGKKIWKGRWVSSVQVISVRCAEVPVDEARQAVVVLEGAPAAAAAHVEAALGEAEVALDVDQQQADVTGVAAGRRDRVLGPVAPGALEDEGGVGAIGEPRRAGGVVEGGHGQDRLGEHAPSLSPAAPACQRADRERRRSRGGDPRLGPDHFVITSFARKAIPS